MSRGTLRHPRSSGPDARTLALARWLLNHQATLQQAASRFGISTSLAHRDLHERLPRLSPSLAADVRWRLSRNLAARSRRGGEGTRRRWRRELDRVCAGPVVRGA